MLARMTAKEFHEWRVYDDLEPFDETRADLRAASIVCAILNVNRGKRRPFKLEECMLRFGDKAGPIKVDPREARRQVIETFRMFAREQKEAKAAKGRRRKIETPPPAAPARTRRVRA